MNQKELFDVLDPATWPNRPLTKVFLLQNFDEEKATQEEVRQTMFKKINDWAGQHLEKIDTMVIERFYEDQNNGNIVPAIQVRFTLKNQSSS